MYNLRVSIVLIAKLEQISDRNTVNSNCHLIAAFNLHVYLYHNFYILKLFQVGTNRFSISEILFYLFMYTQNSRSILCAKIVNLSLIVWCQQCCDRFYDRTHNHFIATRDN